MQRFGIEKLFPTLVSSIDLKQCMPAPEIYLSAVHLMNLTPGEVAFVGHDRVELAGAAAVGMATVAFNFDADAEADAHLRAVRGASRGIGFATRVIKSSGELQSPVAKGTGPCFRTTETLEKCEFSPKNGPVPGLCRPPD